MSKKFLISVVFSLIASGAHAFTECSGKVAWVYGGDNGAAVIALEIGVSGAITASQTDFKTMYSAALAAVATNKNGTLRFAANGVPCTAATGQRGDVVGFFVGNRQTP
jgi:hypothetical protein